MSYIPLPSEVWASSYMRMVWGMHPMHQSIYGCMVLATLALIFRALAFAPFESFDVCFASNRVRERLSDVSQFSEKKRAAFV